jgi:hypothetical protein
MTLTYKWGSGTRPALAGMATTLSFSDASAGDTTTGEFATTQAIYSTPCEYNTTSAALTALIQFSCAVTMSALTLTCARTNTAVSLGGPEDIICTIPFMGASAAGASYSSILEYSLDGVSWTGITYVGTISPTGTSTVTFPAITARYLRIILATSYETYTADTVQTSTVTLSDLRPTYVLAAPASAPTLTGPAVCEGTQNTLTWTAVDCADSYEISIDGGAAINLGNVLSYIHTGLTIGVSVSYKVRAVNATGAGSWSNTVSKAPCVMATAPVAPVMHVLGECEGGQVSLWIDAAAAATSYKLYRTDPTPGQTFLIKTFAAASRPTMSAPYIDTPRAIGVTVRYYAIATNGFGDSAASATVEATPCRTGCDCPAWTLERCV